MIGKCGLFYRHDIAGYWVFIEEKNKVITLLCGPIANLETVDLIRRNIKERKD